MRRGIAASIDPWISPWIWVWEDDKELPTLTDWYRSSRYYFRVLRNVPVIPSLTTLARIMLWQTMSKAFRKSRKWITVELLVFSHQAFWGWGDGRQWCKSNFAQTLFENCSRSYGFWGKVRSVWEYVFCRSLIE